MKSTLNIRLAALALVAVSLVGCGTSDDLPTTPNYSDEADLAGLQAYAAIGNSLTAGYQSGAWGNPEHVAASYPNLIARQLGIADFQQVSMVGTGLGFSGGAPVGNMVVNIGATGPVLSYTTVDAANVAAFQAGAAVDFEFMAPRNFGIPGITLMHAAGASLDAYYAGGLGNPYANFYRNASSGSKTQVQLAAESDASFITCWLGNNDVLGYVTSGGTGSLTPSATFQATLGGTLGALGTAPYLAVLNIPSVTDIPFVTYFNPVLNAKLTALGYPHAVYAMDNELGHAVLILTDAGTNNYILLPAATAMTLDPTLGGSAANPLPDALVLDAAELELAEAAVEDFNQQLADGVAGLNATDRAHDVLLVDMNTFFTHIVAHGYSAYGETFTTQFVSGGIFSLDGVHPTSLGYAIVANQILANLNEHWGLNVELVDLADFIGVNNGLGSVDQPLQWPDFGSVVELFQH